MTRALFAIAAAWAVALTVVVVAATGGSPGGACGPQERTEARRMLLAAAEDTAGRLVDFRMTFCRDGNAWAVARHVEFDGSYCYKYGSPWLNGGWAWPPRKEEPIRCWNV